MLRNQIDMPSLIYGGVRYVLVRNAKYCKKCEDTIESKSVHDFKYCKCKSIAVDGGLQYHRSLGDLKDMDDRSMWRTEAPPIRYLPLSEIERRWKELVGPN